MPMPALVAALLSPTTAAAAGGCEVSIKPEMKGFYLNPTVVSVHVSKVAPPPPGGQCRLVAGDEILRINDRQVKGAKALGVMRYWKSLQATDPRVYTVLRGDDVLVVDVRK
ncbi:MAG TPA: hypothetical protein PKD02_06540 [Thermomonas sp.]|nr:hypothetical protein [Thermomonas sp.]